MFALKKLMTPVSRVKQNLSQVGVVCGCDAILDNLPSFRSILLTSRATTASSRVPSIGHRRERSHRKAEDSATAARAIQTLGFRGWLEGRHQGRPLEGARSGHALSLRQQRSLVRLEGLVHQIDEPRKGGRIGHSLLEMAGRQLIGQLPLGWRLQQPHQGSRGRRSPPT